MHETFAGNKSSLGQLLIPEMRGRILILMVFVAFTWSCEDPNTLSVGKAFSGNNLQTILIDTFSVVTSTVQLDTFLTSNTGTVLLGRYQDDKLGVVSASSYFQVSYGGSFLPDYSSVYDSMVLVLPYNHTVTGDTTKQVKINAYQVTEQMMIRKQPAVSGIRLSPFSAGNGFFSSSSFKYNPTPFASGTVTFFPHTDTVSIRVSDKFGANWFRLAQQDSAHMFSIETNFVNTFFFGMYLNVDPSTVGSVAGFDPQKLKLRIYYKKYYGNYLRQTFHDFKIGSYYQFNNIQFDRSGTALASLQTSKGITSYQTGNISYVQPGTGLVTRLAFPSLKTFFANNPRLILNAANLIVYPEPGTFPKNLLPPSQLLLYTTDMTNIPLSSVAGGAAAINYDYVYGINTRYTFQLFSYFFGQIKSSASTITPMFLTTGVPGNSVQRVYITDRFHPYSKIQLQIYYSYVPN